MSAVTSRGEDRRRQAGFVPAGRLLIVLVAGLLTLPALGWLLRPGFWVSGDGLHHLYRVDELARYAGSGILLPRWLGEFSFGYGAPVFLFYNPLSYVLALPFTPLGSLAATKAAMAAAALLSAVAMFLFARQHARWGTALLVALVYLYLPYRLVDLYVRAALAEHTAFLWFPLILLASDRIGLAGRGVAGHSLQRQVVALVGFGLSWAGLLLTHSFSAVMFAPFSLAYLLLLVWWTRRWRTLLLAGLGGLLAVGLSTFFWLPLLAEQQFAGLGSGGLSTGYRTHLVSLGQLIGSLRYDYNTGALDPNYYYAVGLVPLVLLGLGLASALRRQQGQPSSRRGGAAGRRFLPAAYVALYAAGVALVALFMCLQIAQPLWDALAPLLSPMQFPWRFLSVATLGISLSLLALPLGPVSSRPAVSLLMAGALLALLALAALPSLPWEPLSISEADVTPESFWAFDRETGQVGSTWGGEFLPVWVTEQRWAIGRPPEQPQEGPGIRAPQVTLDALRPDWIDLSVAHSEPWPLRYHAFYFPGWRVRVDGQPVETTASGDLGLVTAQIPAGQHQVRVRFEPTRPRMAGKWLSLASLAVLLALLFWAGRAWSRPWLRWSLLAGGTLLLVVTAWGGPRPRAVQARSLVANLEDRALLIGAYTDRPSYRPGDQANVTLVWLSLAQTARVDKSFVHLLGPDAAVIAQHDGDPGGGFTPTTRWQPGEIVLDRHRLAVPADLPAGSYGLRAGLYQLDPADGTVHNLRVDPPAPDDRVDIGNLIVR